MKLSAEDIAALIEDQEQVRPFLAEQVIDRAELQLVAEAMALELLETATERSDNGPEILADTQVATFIGGFEIGLRAAQKVWPSKGLDLTPDDVEALLNETPIGHAARVRERLQEWLDNQQGGTP